MQAAAVLAALLLGIVGLGVAALLEDRPRFRVDQRGAGNPTETPAEIESTADDAPAADATSSVTPAPAVSPESLALAREQQALDENRRRIEAAVAARLNAQGLELARRENYVAAAARYREAVARAPENPVYRNNYGWALFLTGQAPAAARELRRTLSLAPDREIAHAQLAEVHLVLGDTISAVRALERFVQLAEDDRRRSGEEKLASIRRTWSGR